MLVGRPSAKENLNRKENEGAWRPNAINVRFEISVPTTKKKKSPSIQRPSKCC
jgi:hypothetical protein